MYVALRRFIKSRTDDLCLNLTPEIGHLFGSFINQKNNKVRLRAIRLDGICHALQEDGLTSARWSDNQATLTIAHRSEAIDHPHGKVVPLGVAPGFH